MAPGILVFLKMFVPPEVMNAEHLNETLSDVSCS